MVVESFSETGIEVAGRIITDPQSAVVVSTQAIDTVSTPGEGLAARRLVVGVARTLIALPYDSSPVGSDVDDTTGIAIAADLVDGGHTDRRTHVVGGGRIGKTEAASDSAEDAHDDLSG